MNVFLPYRGEFGHVVMWHSQQVHAGTRPKVVCIEPGMEALYPGCIYHYVESKPDASKRGLPSKDREFREAVKSDLLSRWPNASLIAPKPKAKKLHFHPEPYEPVDVEGPYDFIVCPRRRQYGHRKNWNRWPRLIEDLSSSGFSACVAGKKESSFTNFDSRIPASWQYDRQLDATIAMMQQAQVVVCTDSGLAHLAAMMGKPIVMVTYKGYTAPGTKGVQWKRYHSDHPDGTSIEEVHGWYNENRVFREARKRLIELSSQASPAAVPPIS